VTDHRLPDMATFEWQRPVLSWLNDPPESPAEGDRYLIGAVPTGDWTAHADEIAEWSGAAWDYTPPTAGMVVWDLDEGELWRYGGTWELVPDHDQQHVIDGTDHTTAGLTVGHVLTATGPTTFGFQAPTGGGVSAHSELTELDYASAGHTGFQPAGNYQPLDATLSSIAALGTAASKMLYTTEIDTWAEVVVSDAAGNSSIVRRTSSGYIVCNYLNTTAGVTATVPSHVWVETGSDGYHRKQTPAVFIENIGLGPTDSPTFATLTLSGNLRVNGTYIGVNGDTDLIKLATNILIVNGTLELPAGQSLAMEGAYIVSGTNVGLKILTAANQKLSLFGVTPIVQPTHVDDPTTPASVGGNRNTIVAMLLRLEQLGAFAS